LNLLLAALRDVPVVVLFLLAVYGCTIFGGKNEFLRQGGEKAIERHGNESPKL
jgi:hypothetical protein